MSFKQSLAKASYTTPLLCAFATANAQNKLPVIEPKDADLSKPLSAACVETTSGMTAKDFSTTAKAWGVALLSTMFMASNANAADSKIVELSDLNLSQPIPSNVCFKDSDQGTAISKLQAAMVARNQKSVIVANQVGVATGADKSPFRERLFSSNLQQGGEGYEVNSSAPMGQVGTQYCLSHNQKVYIYSAFNSNGVPAVVNKGELGLALNNNNKVGSKVVLAALTEQGTLSVVNFNPATGEGSLKFADANGAHASDLPIVSAGYSPKLSPAAKKSLGIKMSQTPSP